MKFYGVNIEKIFLYNDDMQKMLVDKINIQFLRDSSFSDVENLFSTRYVRNVQSASSTTPFIVVTDGKGEIKHSGAVKKAEKFTNKLKSLFLDNN